VNSVISSREHAGMLVPADWEHVPELARTMSQADQDACRQAGYEPGEAVFRMLLPSLNKFTFMAGGHVAAMFGTCARPGFHRRAEQLKRTPEGQLWCFTGTYVGLAAQAWVDKFKFSVNELLAHFDSLHSHIGVENQQMLRLARHVGGELEGPLPFGPDRKMFWKYTLR
jgi:hypothetical protein